MLYLMEVGGVVWRASLDGVDVVLCNSIHNHIRKAFIIQGTYMLYNESPYIQGNPLLYKEHLDGVDGVDEANLREAPLGDAHGDLPAVMIMA